MKKPTMQGNLLDDSLPALQELQQHPHWVLWRYEERDGKATKVPYSAITRKRAASDNPACGGYLGYLHRNWRVSTPTPI